MPARVAMLAGVVVHIGDLDHSIGTISLVNLCFSVCVVCCPKWSFWWWVFVNRVPLEMWGLSLGESIIMAMGVIFSN